MKKAIRILCMLPLWCIGKILSFLPFLKFRSTLYFLLDYLFTSAAAASFHSIGKQTILSRSMILINPQNITIGDHSGFGPRTTLSTWPSETMISQNITPEIRIGDHVSIGEGCHITAIQSICIGNHVLMGKYITITDNAHGHNLLEEMEIPPIERKLFSKGAVIIEDNVWIGDKATILPGVKLGSSAIIAANSVVTKDIPPRCVAAGNPAKIIKYIESN